MSFLPQNYTIPENNSNSRYLNPSKLEDSKPTRFRILSKALLGWSYWTNENKPVRLKLEDHPKTTPPDIQIRDGKAKINHFWAIVVYNYNTERLEVLEITQKTIQSQLKTYFDDADYGDPFGYDFKITKTGQELETKYSIIATPPKPFDTKLQKKAIDEGLEVINLEKLISGGNPFEDSDPEPVTVEENHPDTFVDMPM